MKQLIYFSALAGLLLFSSCKKDFEVNRTITIDAPKLAVWKMVSNYENWKHWSPWYANDTTMDWEFTEDGSGYSWISENSGSGSMETTNLQDGERLDYQTHFYEPWESESPGYVELSETDNGTGVEWGFKGTLGFPMSLFMNMDKMIGKDFEQGLALLKDYTEQHVEELMPPKKPVMEIIDFPETHYLGKREVVKFKNMEAFFETHLPGAYEAVFKAGKEPVGQPVGIYFLWDEKGGKTDMFAGMPVSENKALGEYTIETIPQGKAVKYAYYGSYEGLGDAHNAVMEYMNENGLVMGKAAIEEYITDPMEEPDTSKWLTNIYYLLEE